MGKDRYSRLDEVIESEGYDAYLQIDDSTDSNMFYLSNFDAPDPFTLLRKDGETVLLVSLLEYGRARKEASADEVVSTAEYVSGDNRGDDDARYDVLDSFLRDRGVESVGVPSDFSLETAERLRDRGYTVEPIDDDVEETREEKEELEDRLST
ncbi:MAG: aminopeptidase P family N-terminal domain-containing protein, partial [Halobacteria archaeon]|nr:aminopeptidase P family N-terminal domain-containing protein [Halobacteria archaeon]